MWSNADTAARTYVPLYAFVHQVIVVAFNLHNICATRYNYYFGIRFIIIRADTQAILTFVNCMPSNWKQHGTERSIIQQVEALSVLHFNATCEINPTRHLLWTKCITYALQFNRWQCMYFLYATFHEPPIEANGLAHLSKGNRWRHK